MRISGALQRARERLAAVADSPGAEAQTLLAAVLGVDRVYLLTHPERSLTPTQIAAFETLVTRRMGGEPLPYITGSRAFFDRDFFVNPAVLIPRPETELLLEAALEYASERAPAIAVDIGTGSGALAVTFAALHLDWQVYAVDVSPAALAVAQHNAERCGVAERIKFVEGDLLAPLLDAPVRADLIMANLPYIPSAITAALDVSRHEPTLALDGGADGLALIRRLLDRAPDVLALDGLLLLEMQYDQGAALTALAESALPGAQIDILRDYAGHERIVRIGQTKRATQAPRL
ncbi:MAG: peptide chain release factor N(5)-glutamine methyltransferase [Anaerolineae bacterium]|nr:peptide chain release factor N(5)-glutamine methyltransferase [Anaerolineae bacterium]